MANLFGKNKLKSVAQAIDTDDVRVFIETVEKWHHDYHHGTLKQDKETSREQEYNQNFFKDILGYKEKPATPFNFEPKATTAVGQLPDAVVGYTDKANGIENLAAVVELKGASIPLDRPQRREGNMSPVQQGFKYKTQYRNCPFVIVSNFYEFRLYRDNQLDYELWTLDDLVNPDDDYFLFKTWYVLLRSENFITSKGASKTEQLLSDIRIQQEEIGKKFYKVYKGARLGLLRDIYANNTHVRSNIDFGIEKAQKIIDRIVFAAFAEDKGLLPDNTLQRVAHEAERSSFGISLWQALKGLFEAIDTGSDKLEIPGGYNGGLFKSDPKLNDLKISDNALRSVIELGNYNFSEDLSVNILGHIFEQSISDLEEIKTKVNEAQNLEVLNQNRRKKDGIFYTPDYIVRYIVENSLGTYLRKAEERLKTEFRLHGDINDKTYIKREQQAYGKYQDFLQNIKIVDPACGSGAFLVYVFDYLLAENKRVGDILGNTIFSTDSYVRDILRNNIYGVDLNEESVEITKLSLWLKSAQKGKKLTALDNNIKCGNSLIDDSVVAGSKAFDWHEQFVDIFKNGGFDVVIGNPPYGASVSDKDKKFLELSYKTYEYQLNSYSLFYERGLDLLKSDGILGFITPATFTYQRYFHNLRQLLQMYTQISIAKYVYEVFIDANIGDSVSWIIQKTSNNKLAIPVRICADFRDQDLISDPRAYDQVVGRDGCYLLSSSNIVLGPDTAVIPLGTIANITAGIKPYQVGKGMPKQTRETVTSKIFTSDHKINGTYMNCVVGKDFHRYRLLSEPEMYLSYGRWLAEPRENAPFFEDEKIILRQTADSLIGYLDDKKRINLNNVYNVGSLNKRFDIRYVLALLNSKVLNYFYQNISQEKGRTFAEVKKNYLEKLPIVDIKPSDQLELVRLVENITANNEHFFDYKGRFQKLIKTEFGIEKWPTNINKWWTLDFADFIATFKLKLSLQQKDELLQLFEKYHTELTELNDQIQKTDQEIDDLVYKLYNLTPEETAIVKNG